METRKEDTDIMEDLDKKIEAAKAEEETMPAMQEIVHQEIWDTLPEEKKDIVQEIAQEVAVEKGVPLANPFAWEEHPDNHVMMQYFEWYLADDGNHYQRLIDDVPHLKEMGVGGVWLPPACKATGTNDVGYGIYDLYDLGEFDQKGSVRTKYGTKKQFLSAIKALQKNGIQAYADVVLNHKAGADKAETFKVVMVSEDNREHQVSEPFDIDGWTGFTFPGRKNKYSKFKWNFQHFTAVNFDNKTGKMAIYRILGENKDFSGNVNQEKGNFDYLMFSDIDYRNKDVIDETFAWCDWFIKETGIDGMRMDAIKHIDSNFMGAFIRHARLTSDKPMYFVGEYWHNDVGELNHYISRTRDMTALFDVPLHFRFKEAADRGRDYDLRTIFDFTMVREDPLNTATFVDNHDSQPGQALESWVQDWFKPLAYALILLRKDGYPCVFYGDYYGIGGEHAIPGKKDMLDRLLTARKYNAYGEQWDYFDEPDSIGWVRKGDARHPNSGLAVVMSNGGDAVKYMSLGEEHKNTTWYDTTGTIMGMITLDDSGSAHFPCKGGSVSVFVKKV